MKVHIVLLMTCLTVNVQENIIQVSCILILLWWCSHEIKRYLLLGRKAMTHLASILKSRDLTLLTKVLYSLKLFSSLVQMWEVDYKEGWVLKYWCFQSVVLEKTDWVKPVSPKRNQPWIFIGRTDAEAEAPTLWPPDAESTHWKRPSCWERLRAGEEGDDKRWDGWMAWMDMNLGKLHERVKDREAWGAAIYWVPQSIMTEQ